MLQIWKFFAKSKKMVLVIVVSATLLISAGQVNKNFELTKNLDIFASLYRELFINYVDEINPAELITIAIESMLESLDPYTNFISESEIEDYRFMTTGQYGGIGALIHYRNNQVVISDPYKDFPAQKAGLIAGDVILNINGQPTDELSLDDVRTLLHGQPGSEAVLTISRYGHDEPLSKTLTREIIQVDNIPYYGMVDENIGYIKLVGFTQAASREFRDAFTNLGKNDNLGSLIIDLRGNGGGLLNEAVNIVNLFVEKDRVVVETKGRIAERNTVHKTRNNPIDKDIPIIVLTDRGSASAAEIVAGAIQDFDRGVVLGERTFGKGLVQNIVPLTYNTQLKVTIAKYYIPSGRCIQAIDYAKRHEDGSIDEIPDSLKVPFKTKNGRTVYDGGGIEPDIHIERDTPANITIGLLRQYMIFDFATKFYFNNEQINPPAEFLITEDIYNNFISFIKEKEFDYKTSSERQIESVIDAAKEDDYFYLLEEYISTLQAKVVKTKEKDIFTHSNEIKRLLKDEIVGRYYFVNGRIRSSLNDDKVILDAIKILKDKNSYKEILSGL